MVAANCENIGARSEDKHAFGDKQFASCQRDCSGHVARKNYFITVTSLINRLAQRPKTVIRKAGYNWRAADKKSEICRQIRIYEGCYIENSSKPIGRKERSRRDPIRI